VTNVERRAQRLSSAFLTAYRRNAQGVWSAPGRVNLIGEHTDYNDGLVLPVAIDRETLVAAAVRDDDLVRCRSLDLPGGADIRLSDLGPDTAPGWPAYVLGVLWALRETGAELPGLDLLLASDVPVGAGLSSSAALEAAVALCAAELCGATLGRTELAVAARRAENEAVGAPVGIMDQMAALHGRGDCALLLDCRSLQVRPIPLQLDAAGLDLLVINTRVTHAHADGEYASRRQACARAAAALGVSALRDAGLDAVEQRLDGELRRRARHVVTEIERVTHTAEALERHEHDALGPLFASSHASMRDDFQISCPELDLAVESAVRAGAVAARMTGGGFGGCAVAFVPTDLTGAAGAVVRSAFAAQGFSEPDLFLVEPADGARRMM